MITRISINKNCTVRVHYKTGKIRMYTPSHKLPKTVSYFIIKSIAKGNLVVFKETNGDVTVLF